MRIKAEIIFIAAKCQEHQKDIFSQQVHRVLDELKNTKIRTKGLEISCVMNDGPHWLSVPGDGRRELKRAIKDSRRDIFYTRGDKPSEDNESEEKES